MEIKASLTMIRIAPRKTRVVADLIRGKKVSEARNLLQFTVRRSAEPILKLLNSAVASAVNDKHLEEAGLYVSKITVDEGPTLKRSHPMSRGRAYPIMKRTSHIQIVLGEAKKEEKKKPGILAKIKKTKKEKVSER